MYARNDHGLSGQLSIDQRYQRLLNGIEIGGSSVIMNFSPV